MIVASNYIFVLTTLPLFITYIANVQEFQIGGVVFNIDHVFLYTRNIGRTLLVGTSESMQMRQCRVILGKFIQEYFIGFRRFFLNNCFHHKASVLVFCTTAISTVATYTAQALFSIFGLVQI